MMVLTKATVDKIIRKAGAERVSEDAVLTLGKYLDDLGVTVARKAITLARDAQRKTVRDEDIHRAFEII
jgi:histone H3/H4